MFLEKCSNLHNLEKRNINITKKYVSKKMLKNVGPPVENLVFTNLVCFCTRIPRKKFQHEICIEFN